MAMVDGDDDGEGGDDDDDDDRSKQVALAHLCYGRRQLTQLSVFTRLAGINDAGGWVWTGVPGCCEPSSTYDGGSIVGLYASRCW